MVYDNGDVFGEARGLISANADWSEFCSFLILCRSDFKYLDLVNYLYFFFFKDERERCPVANWFVYNDGFELDPAWSLISSLDVSGFNLEGGYGELMHGLVNKVCLNGVGFSSVDSLKGFFETNLTSVELSDNELKNSDLEEIFLDIRSVSRVQVLDFSKNDLELNTSFSSFLGNFSELIDLNLSRNRMHEFNLSDGNFFTCTSLSKLELAWNSFNSLDWIFDFTSHLKSLERLELAGNQLSFLGETLPKYKLNYLGLRRTGVDAGVLSLIAGCGMCDFLSELDVSYNSLRGRDLLCFESQLFEFLNLSGVGFVGEFLKVLVEQGRAKHLIEIRLDECVLNCEDVVVLKELLRCRVSSLSLISCGVDMGRLSMLSSDSLARLKWLNISLNSLCYDGFDLLFSMLGSGLLFLDLSGCGLDDSGCGCFCESFHFYDLNRLDLSDNCIGDEGILKLSKVLCGDDLNWLDISVNGFSSMNFYEFINSDFCRNLESLKLDYNNIGDDGLRFIFESKNLSRLKVLSVVCCSVTERGLVEMIDSGFLMRLNHFEFWDDLIESSRVSEMIKSSDKCSGFVKSRW